MNLPEKYINNIRQLLGDDSDAFFESLLDQSFKGIRVNRLKITCEDFEKICPFEIEKIPFIDNGYYVVNKDEADLIAKHPYYYAGLYYIQEPSAMLPANRLEICEGDRVLDLCAAPGGKATELAGKLGGSGVLYANDISASRAKALLKNLEMCGAKNIYVTAEEPEKLSNVLKGYFNKILVDAPCSGEGMFRKDESLIKSWEEKGPEYYAKIQKGILDSAYDLLSPGGYLLYSTCTFSKLEDEDSIRYLLDKHDDLALCDIKPYDGFEKGFSDSSDDSLEKCVRVFPHKMRGEGHFLALIKKSGDVISLENDKCKEYTDKAGFRYLLPGLSDNGFRKGLRYLRTGLLISDDSNKKSKLSQSYAMSLKKDEFDNILDLSSDDIRVIKYLKGETIFLNEDEDVMKGYVLILVDGYSLGFAINDGRGTLKNMYSKGWRMN